MQNLEVIFGRGSTLVDEKIVLRSDKVISLNEQ